MVFIREAGSEEKGIERALGGVTPRARDYKTDFRIAIVRAAKIAITTTAVPMVSITSIFDPDLLSRRPSLPAQSTIGLRPEDCYDHNVQNACCDACYCCVICYNALAYTLPIAPIQKNNNRVAAAGVEPAW